MFNIKITKTKTYKIYGLLKRFFLIKIFFSLFVFSKICLSYANTLFFKQLESLALNIPEVQEGMNQIEKRELEKIKISIEGKPTLNFSTRGNYPISSNISKSRSRANNNDTYLDAELTLNYPIYDFGEKDFRVLAEEQRKKADQIELQKIKQIKIFDILDLCIEIIKSELTIKLLKEDIQLFEQMQSLANDRYLGGTGTLTSLRRLDLMGLGLTADLNQTEFEKEFQQKAFLKRFKADSIKYVNLVKTNIKNLKIIQRPLIIKNLSFLKKSFLLIKASNDEIKSIKASRWPSLDLKLTGNFYEAESSLLNENELLGGIGVSMPLYDSKLRDTQIKSLLIDQKTTSQNRKKAMRDIEVAFRENKTSLEKLIISKIDNKKKLTNISNNLKQLKSSSIAIKGAEFEIASLELQRRSLLRELALYNWNEKKLSLENGLITENLNEILLNINKIEKKNG